MKYILSLIMLMNFLPLPAMTQNGRLRLTPDITIISKKLYCYTCQKSFRKGFIGKGINYWQKYIICHDCHASFNSWEELAEHQLNSLHIPVDTQFPSNHQFLN